MSDAIAIWTQAIERRRETEPDPGHNDIGSTELDGGVGVRYRHVMLGRCRYRGLTSDSSVAAPGHDARSGIIIGTDESVADRSPRSSGPERTAYTVAARSKVPKTTIIDIAAASGVSVATVSRILNDKPDVAESTRKRVLRVMDEIGFAPQSAWRQIRSGRTGLIAVHRPEEFNPPAYRLVLAAALGVEDAGYSINIITRSLARGTCSRSSGAARPMGSSCSRSRPTIRARRFSVIMATRS